MDETEVKSEQERTPTFRRRGLFGRAFAVVGAGAGLLALSGCPGGEQDDDEDEDDD